MLHLCSLLCTLALAAAIPLEPLLTTIRDTPDLSDFYSLFGSSGGELGKPGPDFEERFNIANVSLPFTALAPTNEALARLPSGLVSALTLPSSYELLKAFLDNHIAPGNLTDADLTGPGTTRTVEGFTVTFHPSGGIATNAELPSYNMAPSAQANLVRQANHQLACIPASNGRVCKIDNVLDGFLTYFGEDAAAHSDDLPPVRNKPDTIEDIIKDSSDLSLLHEALQKVDPAFLSRLSLFSEDQQTQRSTVYLAPSNAAFDALPDKAFVSMIQPSNAGLSRFLLELGFGEFDEATQALSSTQLFNITLKRGKFSNAVVTDRRCADNGCVWVIGRLLDPIYGATNA